MIRLLQVNLGGGSAAQDLALQTAAELSAEILLVSEFYKFGKVHEQWYCDTSNRAAIAVLSSTPVGDFDVGNDGFVWVTIAGMRIYSCYWSPNTTDVDFELFLRRLEASVRASPVRVVVAGDLNAKHSAWSSPVSDGKGEALADVAQALDLAVMNCGDVPTREREAQRSYIDVTMVSSGLQHRVAGWCVMDEETLSDYRYLTYAITATLSTNNARTGWSIRQMDKEKFLESLATWEPADRDSAEECAQDFMSALTRGMDCSTPRRAPAGTKRKSVHWWSRDIAALRRDSNHARRTYQRKEQRHGLHTCQEEHDAAKRAKLALTNAIRRAKESAWANLCALVNDDPWGKPYRVVMSRLGVRRPIPGIGNPGRVDAIVEGLFPTHALRPRPEWPGEEPFEEVTITEVGKLAREIPRNKAPGPDNIPGEALKLLVRSRPQHVANLFNRCLRQGVFQSEWKRAWLVLLRKGADLWMNPTHTGRCACWTQPENSWKSYWTHV